MINIYSEASKGSIFLQEGAVTLAWTQIYGSPESAGQQIWRRTADLARVETLHSQLSSLTGAIKFYVLIRHAQPTLLHRPQFNNCAIKLYGLSPFDDLRLHGSAVLKQLKYVLQPLLRWSHIRATTADCCRRQQEKQILQWSVYIYISIGSYERNPP